MLVAQLRTHWYHSIAKQHIDDSLGVPEPAETRSCDSSLCFLVAKVCCAWCQVHSLLGQTCTPPRHKTFSSIDTRQCHFANGATENDTCILDHLNLVHLHVHLCLTATFSHTVWGTCSKQSYERYYMISLLYTPKKHKFHHPILPIGPIKTFRLPPEASRPTMHLRYPKP